MHEHKTPKIIIQFSLIILLLQTQCHMDFSLQSSQLFSPFQIVSVTVTASHLIENQFMMHQQSHKMSHDIQVTVCKHHILRVQALVLSPLMHVINGIIQHCHVSQQHFQCSTQQCFQLFSSKPLDQNTSNHDTKIPAMIKIFHT